MNRKDFQRMAEVRLQDAILLFKNRRYDGAYYLAGYTIEFALKACIARKTKRHDFPDVNFSKKVHIHKLAELLEHAGLVGVFNQEFKRDPSFEVKWALAMRWSEQSRYEAHGRRKARDMVQAVGDSQGIFACIKKYW